MAIYYLDTSALVKLYVPEIGSQGVDRIVNAQDTTGELENAVIFAVIGIAETAAAIARRWREGMLDDTTRQELYAAFLDDREHLFTILALSDDMILLAAELTQQFSLHGYDAVHLASALVFERLLHAEGSNSLVFVSADEALLEAADAVGLRTEIPIDEPG